MRRAPAVLAVVGLLAPLGLAAQDASWRTDFSKHTLPLAEIVSGGVPKDGIPAIDRPAFVSVKEADRWLADREPVILVHHEDDARAYPYQVIIWHEIVNDVVGGLPLAVTYCPLCNTALAFRRTHRGKVLDFGTTGRLRHSDLVMYDRQTERLVAAGHGRSDRRQLRRRHAGGVPVADHRLGGLQTRASAWSCSLARDRSRPALRAEPLYGL